MGELYEKVILYQKLIGIITICLILAFFIFCKLYEKYKKNKRK